MTLDHAADLEHRYDPDQMAARAHAVLDAAYAAGIRHIDVARSYGRGEEFVGSWLTSRELSPGALVIASKWGYTYTANWRVDSEAHEVKDHSLATLERQVAESRAILGGHLSLYQIHSVTAESPVLHDAGVIDALARLRDAGIRIGLTASGAWQADVIRRALEVRRDGVRLFDTVQATWNLLERSAEPALEDAHAEGLTVIVKEVLANGRLTARNTDATFAVPLACARTVAEQVGASTDALAIAAVLARPWADVVLSGAATVGQLQSNLAALDVEWCPSFDLALEAMAMSSPTYWRIRTTFPWN